MNNVDALFKVLVEGSEAHEKMCLATDCDDCRYSGMGKNCSICFFATYLDAHGVVVKTEVVNE